MFTYQVRFFRSVLDDESSHIVFNVESETDDDLPDGMVESARKMARKNNIDLTGRGFWTCELKR